MPKCAKITVICLLAVSGAWAGDMTAYVINTLGETLDKVDLTTGTVTKNISILGGDIYCYPNQIVVRDTLAYVLMSGTHEIQIIDLQTEATVGWIDFPAYSNPYWMAFLDDENLYVSLMTANSLATVDVTARQMIGQTEVGLSPEGVLLFERKVYVAVTGYNFDIWDWEQGAVVVFDTDAKAVIDSIPVGANPQFMALDDSGRIHVVCTGNYSDIAGIVYVIDPETDMVVDSLATGGTPGQIAIGADRTAWVAAGGWGEDGKVFSYHSLTGDLYHGAANPIYIDSGAIASAAFQDSTVFVATLDGDRLFRLDAAGDVTATYHTGDGPVHLDFNYLPGDVNGDWAVNVADAVYLVNYIFINGPVPPPPGWRANPNGDNEINVGDAVYIIDFVFRGGPRPKIGPTWIR